MNVTIKDIAHKAGVSDTAVSLAFKESSRISVKTRKKILAIARKLNYVPNLPARNLRQGKTKTIGFIVNDIINPFYALMLSKAEAAALKRGFQLIFAVSGWESSKELSAIDNMFQARVEGILICFCGTMTKTITVLQRSSIPSIAVDTYPDMYKGPFVANDLVQAGYIAAKHLTEAGCRHIAFLTGGHIMESFSGCIQMQKGLTRWLKKCGIRFDKKNTVDAGLSVDGGKKGLYRLLQEMPEVDGIFCVNDLCAMGAIDAAEGKGRRIGKDLAVIGIDNLEVSALSRLSLTSIRLPYEGIAELATETLINSIENNRKPEISRFFEPELIIRESANLE